MAATVEKPVQCYECDSCGAEAWGYPQHELVKAGWVFHCYSGSKTFVCCDICEAKYARRRTVAKAMADAA